MIQIIGRNSFPQLYLKIYFFSFLSFGTQKFFFIYSRFLFERKTK